MIGFLGPALSAVGAVAGALGGGSPTQTTTSDNRTWSQYTPNPATLPLYGMLAGGATQLGQTPTPYFPGQGYVSPSAPTQYGVNQGMAAIQNQLPWLNNVAGQNYGFLSNAADVANNPYVQGQLGVNAQQVGQQLREQWLPQINAGAQQVNALGSTRHGVAQAQAAERAAQQLSNANASTMLTAYGQGLNAQQGALGQLGNLQQAALAPSQAALGLGRSVEGYQGAALQDAMNRFGYQYQEPWSRLGQVQGTLGAFQNLGTTQGYGQGSSTAPNPNYVNPIQGALGGALSGLSIYQQGKNAGIWPGTY